MNELRGMFGPGTDEAAERAASSLRRAAARKGLVDVGYAFVASPVGDLLIASGPRGIVRVAFPEEPLDHVLEDLAETISPRVLEAPELLDEARREMEEYFEGHRKRFELRVDLTGVRGFFLSVLEATSRIPYGSVSTYGHVAALAGSPRAARAAGNALHDNPIPIVVPCHRVVPATGGVGQYGGQEHRKEFLLALEGAWDPGAHRFGRRQSRRG
jgi:methylated-DNA-[protein]-cysteine S-methyltransferase